MKHFKSIELSNGSRSEIIYVNTSIEAISTAIENAFKSDGYSYYSGGTQENRCYVKGNQTARAFLNALVNFYEFVVSLEQLDDTQIKVNVSRNVKGKVWSAVEMYKFKRELARIEKILQKI